jgi:hypothetical protein
MDIIAAMIHPAMTYAAMIVGMIAAVGRRHKDTHGSTKAPTGGWL